MTAKLKGWMAGPSPNGRLLEIWTYWTGDDPPAFTKREFFNIADEAERAKYYARVREVKAQLAGEK